MRYRATISDTGGLIGPADMANLESKALGKPVAVMFTEHVGDVVGVGHGQGGVTVLFESDRDLAGLGLVPAYRDGALDCFGLVPGGTAGAGEVRRI